MIHTGQHDHMITDHTTADHGTTNRWTTDLWTTGPSDGNIRPIRPARPMVLLSVVLWSCGPVSGALPAPVSLGGPEVVKLDWNTRSLQAADVNGDGFKDLLLINNDASQIEVLRQVPPGAPRPATRAVSRNRWEPVIEDARFERISVIAGISLCDLAVGDVNGDGRPDLVYTGSPDSLTVRLQDETGAWPRKTVIDVGTTVQWAATLKVADVDGDKRDDIVVMTQRELVLVRQGPNGSLDRVERFANADEGCYGLVLGDFNGDGRTDIHYLSPSKRDSFRVRFQFPDGSIGPERPLEIPLGRSTLQRLPAAPGGDPVFCYVQSPVGQLQMFTLSKEAGDGFSIDALQPRTFSTQASGRIPACYAFGDLDGDGRTDLAVGDGEGARMLVHLQRSDGGMGEALRFPSLPDARSITAVDWNGDRRAELFIASPKEKTLGMTGFTKEGRLAYPHPVAVAGRPVAVEAVPGRAPGLAVVVEEGGKRRIDFLEPGGDGVRTVATAELEGLKTDPRGLRFVDADQDGTDELAVFIPFEPMRLLRREKDGTWRDLSRDPSWRKGLVDGLEPAQFGVADVTGDGRAEMLVAGGGFARALRLGAEGLEVVDQFNARESSAEVAAVMAGTFEKKGATDVLLMDRKTDTLQLLRRNERGVYEFVQARTLGKIELVGTALFDFDRNGRPDLFFLGKDRFWWIPLGREDVCFSNGSTYKSDLREVAYHDVNAGDLNGDGVPELVAADVERNVVEVIGSDGRGGWSSMLHFKVFEVDRHFQGRRGGNQEPRETIIADVTGDGKDDLVMLVHDRVLIYPQMKADEPAPAQK